MTVCLFDDAPVAHLAPLTRTRAAFDLRVGAWTLAERAVAMLSPDRLAVHTRASVLGVTREEHPEAVRLGDVTGPVLLVNGRWRISSDAASVLRDATPSGPIAWVQGDDCLALWLPEAPDEIAIPADAARIAMEGETVVSRLWHLLDAVGERVAEDLRAMGSLGEHADADVQTGAILAHPEAIHLAPGATVRPGAVLNAASGPIRLEAGATVEENAVVRGPVWLGPGAVVKAGARVDASAIGERAKVGGEVHASIVHSLSNKGHDGYLGNSYLGRWCNLGADTNTSNLRNDYGSVSLWDPVEAAFVPTDRQFLGLVMGDHSKCAIDTQFNTGTVVGVSCNLFGAGFHDRHVRDFSWGTPDAYHEYRPDKALRVAEAVMARRNRTVTEAVRERLLAIHTAR
ncbi:MAG: putative sugar nucleotidyl transferase [Bacteroidota bacterium]